MELRVGTMARSKAGHDKGADFIVLKTDGEYAYLADGKTRKVERPKKKKLKHIQVSGKCAEEVVKAMENGEELTNCLVRKALAQFNTRKCV